MGKRVVQAYRCSCEVCRDGGDALVQEAHEHINLLLTRLDEQQRRWFVAVLAEMHGLRQGGVKKMAQVTGVTEKTIYRGLHELDSGLESRPAGRVRREGAGRPKRPIRLMIKTATTYSK